MEIEDTSLNNQSVDDVEEDENKMSIGKKIDNLFARLETALKEHDADTSEKLLEESNVLIEKGGDWDRRNRNRVYEGIFYVSFKHEFVKAADLLSSCIGTFAVTSLMSYERFIFIASATGILCFDRNRMKKDILDNSDVIGSSTECRSVIEMGNALYKSEYSTFIKKLKETVVLMFQDDILNKSVDWYCKEMRIKAYKQIMQSYLAVKLETFANEFGLPVEMVEKELEMFIAQGRLAAQIDKVNGVVMNSHKDKRNEMYVKLIKEGDVVIEKLQRLERKME